MRFIFTVFPLLILAPAGFYFYRLFRRAMNQFKLDKNIWVSRIICIALAIALVLWTGQIRGTGFVAGMHFLAVALILEPVNLVLKHMLPGSMRSVWKAIYRSGILIVVFTVMIVGYGSYNMKNVVETRYEITSDKLRSGETLKIAMISDLHLGMNMHADGLAEHLEKIKAASPDVFLLVGDLFDEGTSREDMLQAAELFGNMDTTYGVFYVYGNHDVNQYRADKAYSPEEMTAVLKAAGINILADDAVVLENGISIIGRLDRSFGIRGDVTDLVTGLPNDGLKILLDHQPADMVEKAEAGIDLQVSGHTHAGQIWPFGQFSELAGFNEINYGLREYDDMTAIVTSGIAGWGFPIRTAERCEYVIIEISGV